MPENKTQPTTASVEAYLASSGDPLRHSEGVELVALMGEITRQPPVMWGESIVGFGAYHYQYASGRKGDMCRTGFSLRKSGISIYLVASAPNQDALLAQLGQHKMGVACLTFKRLSAIDLTVLRTLIEASYLEVNRRYP